MTGVALKPDRKGHRAVISGSVLLAAGGFSANDALATEVAPRFGTMTHLGAASATGIALQLGLSAGAYAQRLDACAVALVALPGNVVVPPALFRSGGLLVNQLGQAFAVGVSDPIDLVERVRAQPGRVAYLLFDERIAAIAREPDPFFAQSSLPRIGRRNDAIAHLAKQFELPVDALNASLEAHNARGPHPIEAPYQAIRVTAGRVATLGGLTVDTHARVLDPQGQPIAGLYATGGAVASLAGRDPDGGLAGVDTITALALGRLAAQDAAARLAEPGA